MKNSIVVEANMRCRQKEQSAKERKIREGRNLSGLLLLCGLLLSAVFGCAQSPRTDRFVADAAAVKITGCYSNIHYNEGGGDLLGYEFLIVHARGAYYLLYQHSEGEPDAPLLFPVTIDGASIYFTLPQRVPRGGEFSGTITADGLTGVFSGNGEQIEMKRKNSYWF